MGDYWDNAVRHPEDIGVGHIRRTVRWNSNGVGTSPGVKIGTLEAGAIPLRVTVIKTEVFNGTTPTLDIGTVAAPTGAMATATTAPGTLGLVTSSAGTALATGPLAADTTFYALQGGTGQTTGAAIVIIEFVNKRENVGIPFPNNP
jgi:hypothetical protein